MDTDTLLLTRNDVAELLSVDECIDAVEHVFKLYGEGKTLPPKILGIHTTDGGVHIKAGILNLKRTYFVTKINANFPGNTNQYGLPTIQGIVVLCDGDNGRLLSLMDSIEITIIRTGAATAVAAKYLALTNAKIVTICGCGNQGKISLTALMKVRDIKKVFAYDIDECKTQNFQKEFINETEVVPITPIYLGNALMQSDICVTCTPSKHPFIDKGYIRPGTFIAAVGADSEHKQELYSDLLTTNKVVTDLTEQAASIGELHHAIRQEKISADHVYAELGEVVANKKPGRESDEEIIIFDSTGIALQDVAAAAIVYEKAMTKGMGIKMNFAETTKSSDISVKNQKTISSLMGFFPFK